MTRPAPKPANFDALTRTWDNPEAFAAEQLRYYAELGAERAASARDITEPLHPQEVD